MHIDEQKEMELCRKLKEILAIGLFTYSVTHTHSGSLYVCSSAYTLHSMFASLQNTQKTDHQIPDLHPQPEWYMKCVHALTCPVQASFILPSSHKPLQNKDTHVHRVSIETHTHNVRTFVCMYTTYTD